MTAPHRSRSDPSPWIHRWADQAPPEGGVLDLACGGGRNGRLFLARGRRTVFLDRDVRGVEDLVGAPDAEVVEADLESGGPFPLAGRTFAAIVVVNYLWRPILPDILAAAAPGGLLLYETFMAGNEAFGRPSNPDFLLRPGELRAAVGAAFEALGFEEGRIDEPGPAVKQRIAARRRAQA
ncbi:MAG: class I SAM-dependent methyltransferase [Alphaproteobacteria bacterium]|nr:class I SAM-dependent methyltransferase [Alphaproteobacteria bacterium]